MKLSMRSGGLLFFLTNYLFEVEVLGGVFINGRNTLKIENEKAHIFFYRKSKEKEYVLLFFLFKNMVITL